MNFRQAQTSLRARVNEYVVLTAVIGLLASVSPAQTKPAADPNQVLTQELNKYPGLLPEIGQLMEKIQREIQLPPERSESKLLPLLPEDTIFYAALPNYGEASHEIMKIFQRELPQSPGLNAWWHHGELAKDGPQIESSIEKVYQLSQYLGDEIVISGTSDGDKTPNLLILAEVRKPGLKALLSQMSFELAGKSKPPARIFDPQELATAKDTGSSRDLVVLVRPDYLIASLNLATLRSFNFSLDQNVRDFAATSFGQRIAQAYQGGVSGVGAIDLQRLLTHIPIQSAASEQTLKNSGFADMKYLVWEHKSMPGGAASQMELSFTGPRHGIASWLAAPGPMGTLDFVSPKAILATTLLLKEPAQIFDDIRDLATASNPNAFAAVTQMELGLKMSLKEDILRRLTGEITLEMDSPVEKQPMWRVILRVNDPERLQANVGRLLSNTPIRQRDAVSVEDGIVYHILGVPSPGQTMEFAYAFVDGYLIVAPGQDSVSEAVRLHRNGESLAKFPKFLEALPPGHAQMSALVYEEPTTMAMLNLRRIMPEMAENFSQASAAAKPVVITAYGEENVLREISKSGGADAGVMLVAAAIAIPNLLRARIAANESSAVGTVRTAVTAEIAYSATYPQRGFARNLAMLGPDPAGPTVYSASHAGLIDATLGNPSCSSGAWCTKSGFRFSIKAMCREQRCTRFMVIATPESSNTGTKNFCALTDGVIRFKIGEPLLTPITFTECRSWDPLQ